MTGDIVTEKADPSALGCEQAVNRANGCALSRAVMAEQSHDLTGGDVKTHVEHDLLTPVTGEEAVDDKHIVDLRARERNIGAC